MSEVKEVIANASANLAAVPDTYLTSFIAGSPSTECQSVIDFIAPTIESPVKFSYRSVNQANALGILDPLMGQNGEPAVIQFDNDSLVTGNLDVHAVELPYKGSEQQIDAQLWSVQKAKEEKAMFLANILDRARLARLWALIDANTSGSTIDFSSDNDPIKAIQTEIDTLLALGIPLSSVKVLFGQSAWTSLKQHNYLVGGVYYSRESLTKMRLSDYLEIPAENIMVSNQLKVSSTQGATITRANVVTTADMLIFAQDLNVYSPSCIKHFAARTNGSFKYTYEEVKHAALNNINLGVAVTEKFVVTNSSNMLYRTVSTT